MQDIMSYYTGLWQRIAMLLWMLRMVQKPKTGKVERQSELYVTAKDGSTQNTRQKRAIDTMVCIR